MNKVTKILVAIFLYLIGGKLMAQSTINPDSVCLGSSAESYWVTNNPNSSYQWIIDPSTGGNICFRSGNQFNYS